MNTALGLVWGAIILTFAGAVLAAYSSATLPLKTALDTTTIWGSAFVPAKLLLHQKAYTSGAIVAITVGLVFQLTTLLDPKGRDGILLLTNAAVVSLLTIVFTWSKAKELTRAILQHSARQRGSSGKLVDVERVLSPQTDAKFLEMIGNAYELKRKKDEVPDDYRRRLAQHIERLAQES